MWTFDISSLKEAQAVLRRRLNYDSIYESEDDIPTSLSQLIQASGETRTIREDGENDNSQRRQ